MSNRERLRQKLEKYCNENMQNPPSSMIFHGEHFEIIRNQDGNYIVK